MAEIYNVDRITTQRIAVKAGAAIKEEKFSASSPIGLFDSGVGGLTVFGELQRQLPKEDLIYIADTVHLPYGGRPAKEIIKINHQLLTHLTKLGVKLIIMACGTSSAIAYPIVSKEYRTGMVSIIGPACRAAIEASNNGYIGILATVGTIESGAYQKRLVELHNQVVPTAVAAPLLVPLIEGGFTAADETRRVLKEYLKPFMQKGCDTIILGCTHYPHVAPLIQEIVGPKVTLIDPAIRTVEESKTLLEKRNLLNEQVKPPNYTFLVTGSVVQFQELGSKLTGKTLSGAKSLNV
jgi:glutamate racemase